jgi:hypothetical protein
MAAKKVSLPPSTKTRVQEPVGIAFDFENLIAAAVAAVTLKRPRKRRIATRRDPR